MLWEQETRLWLYDNAFNFYCNLLVWIIGIGICILVLENIAILILTIK